MLRGLGRVVGKGSVRFGIVACEGHNHFYEFEISEPETSPTLAERLRW